MNKNFLHRLFRISIFIKGLNSVLEIISGFLLFFVKPYPINNFFRFLFQHELIEDPNDFLGNFLINLFSNLSAETQLFGAIYLLSHGLIKAGLIIGLWKEKLWTYLLAEAVFVFLIIYQIYRFTYTHSVFLLALTLLDIIIVILTWIEYKKLKKLNI